jgi:hypothetical protein
MQAVLSTIYRIVKPSKSFNPVLGETYQGFMSTDWPNIRSEMTGDQSEDD